MVVIRLVVPLLLLALAFPPPAQSSGGKPASPPPLTMGAPPALMGVSPLEGDPSVAPPTSPELEEAIREAAETIRTSSANKLSDLIDLSATSLTCLACNCTYGYTSQMPLGDIVYSINFFLSYVQSVQVADNAVRVKSRENSIVVTTDRKILGDAVRDVRSYDSFEIYLYDREVAEQVAQHVTKARDLCRK